MIPPDSWTLDPRKLVILINLLLNTLIGGPSRSLGRGMETRSFGLRLLARLLQCYAFLRPVSSLTALQTQ